MAKKINRQQDGWYLAKDVEAERYTLESVRLVVYPRGWDLFLRDQGTGLIAAKPWKSANTYRFEPKVYPSKLETLGAAFSNVNSRTLGHRQELAELEAYASKLEALAKDHEIGETDIVGVILMGEIHEEAKDQYQQWRWDKTREAEKAAAAALFAGMQPGLRVASRYSTKKLGTVKSTPNDDGVVLVSWDTGEVAHIHYGNLLLADVSQVLGAKR